jgi:hypothetical protein
MTGHLAVAACSSGRVSAGCFDGVDALVWRIRFLTTTSATAEAKTLLRKIR